MTESVSLTMPCPACGRDCTWTGTRTEPNHGTAYRILCDHCDWTWQEQTKRAQERDSA